MILEACVGTVEDAKKAQNNGAHQIELCDRLDLDGTSPPIKLIKEVLHEVDIPVKVIVNPKPYDYTYTTEDLAKIGKYVNILQELPLAGIVFGALTEEKTPDLGAIEFINKKYSGPITFHKAVDNSIDILHSTKLLAEQNIVSFILTSGGAPTALEGVPTLLQMKELLLDSNAGIELIAAGKITSSILKEIHPKINLKYYHGKKIVD